MPDIMNIFPSKSNKEEIDLSIIIVNWNSWAYLQKLHYVYY